MPHTVYIPGEWEIICDVCGTSIKASQAKHRWDGLIVCPDDWEPRHPQDFVKTKQDVISVPFSRPEAPDTFGLAPACTIQTIHPYAGLGTAGCMVVGLNSYSYEYLVDPIPDSTFNVTSPIV